MSTYGVSITIKFFGKISFFQLYAFSKIVTKALDKNNLIKLCPVEVITL